MNYPMITKNTPHPINISNDVSTKYLKTPLQYTFMDLKSLCFLASVSTILAVKCSALENCCLSNVILLGRRDPAQPVPTRRNLSSSARPISHIPHQDCVPRTPLGPHVMFLPWWLVHLMDQKWQLIFQKERIFWRVASPKRCSIPHRPKYPHG